MELCVCARDALCDRCVADGYAQLRGVAASRGRCGAERVLVRMRPREHWPDTDEARAWALRRVADLSRDRRLLEMLALEATRYAAKRWGAKLPCPDDQVRESADGLW